MEANAGDVKASSNLNGNSTHGSKPATSTITTVAKKKSRPVAESLAVNSGISANSRKHQSSPYDQRTSPNKKGLDAGACAMSGFTAYTRGGTPRQKYLQKDEDCFDIDLNNIHSKEFD